jgi:Zn ribbon nucleic-acid-binding protein
MTDNESIKCPKCDTENTLIMFGDITISPIICSNCKNAIEIEYDRAECVFIGRLLDE